MQISNFVDIAHFICFGGKTQMKVTIDLDRDIIIIPDNFFKKVSEDNERLKKYGATPLKAIDRIKRAFDVAMADTDNRLLTRNNAKESTVTKLPVNEKIVKVESTIDREATAADNE